jgi:(p)ppGpp synthase/HD superfamily hydrolase
VVEFLVQLQPDLETLQAALMHDLIEDTPVTYEDVTKEFGDEVAWLCE